MAKTRVVGLDLGTTQVRAVELEFGKGGPRAGGSATLVRHGAVDLPPGAVQDGEVADPAAVSEALRRLWREAGIRTKDVVIGVGNQHVVVRELDLPWMPLDDLKRSLPFQVTELLPMPVDEALLDFHPTEEVVADGARRIRGMLVVAGRATVSANLAAVTDAGLRPAAVDLNAFALQRALIRGDLRTGTVALVDVGSCSTTVVVAAHGQPKLVRIIASGGRDTAVGGRGAPDVLAGAPTAQPALGPETGRTAVGLREPTTETIRSLVESIRNTFVYYASNHPGAGIDRALLTGGGASGAGLDTALSSASRVPVSPADPLACVTVPPALEASVRRAAPRLAVSIGLAHGSDR